VGVGLLGLVTAKSMNDDFAALIGRILFEELKVKNTFLEVSKAQFQNYAQGYSITDAPIRMAPGLLAAEAYGMRTTAADLLRFVKANMRMIEIDEDLQKAIVETHMGYYNVGEMTQDLIWEQYPYPVGLEQLLAGNSAKLSYEANPVTKIDPLSRSREDVLIDKTGSTNGFAAYVAFVPAKKLGIVLLANKNCPIDARVTAAYQILTRLDQSSSRR
jgi:beta-lactamase class C